MRKAATSAALALLCLLSAPALAQVLSGDSVHVYPRATVSPACPVGQVCLWSPSSGPNVGKLLQRDAGGGDTVWGGGSLLGDVTGPTSATVVGGLQGRAFAATLPLASQVVYWTGSTWAPRSLTADDIAPAFTLTLAANGFSTIVQCGATIPNPQFNATHSQAPASATLTDVNGTCTLGSPSATALGFGGAANTCSATSYTVTTVNGTRTWTYAATNASGVVAPPKSVTATYEPLVYFGMSTAGPYTAGFITALSSALSAVTARTIPYADGGGTLFAYYAIPASYTAPASFLDNSTGFHITYSLVATVSLPNACGTGNAVSYNLYGSDFPQGGAFSGVWS